MDLSWDLSFTPLWVLLMHSVRLLPNSKSSGFSVKCSIMVLQTVMLPNAQRLHSIPLRTSLLQTTLNRSKYAQTVVVSHTPLFVWGWMSKHRDLFLGLFNHLKVVQQHDFCDMMRAGRHMDPKEQKRLQSASRVWKTDTDDPLEKNNEPWGEKLETGILMLLFFDNNYITNGA